VAREQPVKTSFNLDDLLVLICIFTTKDCHCWVQQFAWKLTYNKWDIVSLAGNKLDHAKLDDRYLSSYSKLRNFEQDGGLQMRRDDSEG
jgi:hypothetical protein